MSSSEPIEPVEPVAVDPAAADAAPAAAAALKADDDVFEEPRKISSSGASEQLLIHEIELGEVFPTCQADLGSGITPADAPMVSTDQVLDLRAKFRYFCSIVSEDVNQPIVCDGDSLLLEAVAHTAGDWHHGGQPLTVVFFVEKLLGQLSEGGREIHIIFLEALGTMWSHEPAIQLIRTILIQHLKQHGEELQQRALLMSAAATGGAASKLGPDSQIISRLHVHTFDSWWCAEFADGMKRIAPELILIGDGEAAYPHLKDTKVEKPSAPSSGSAGGAFRVADTKEILAAAAAAAEAKAALRRSEFQGDGFRLTECASARFAAYTMSLVLARYTCARLVEFEVQNRKINSFLISLDSDVQEQWFNWHTRFRPAHAAFLPTSSSLTKSTTDAALIQSLTAKLIAVLGGSVHTRLLLSANVVAQCLRADASLGSSLQIVLLAAYLLPRLSLHARAQPLAPAADQALQPLLQTAMSSFAQHAVGVFNALTADATSFISTASNAAMLRAARCDLWDGRLIYSLAHLCWGGGASSELLDADSIAVLSAVWAAVCEAAGVKVPPFALDRPAHVSPALIQTLSSCTSTSSRILLTPVHPLYALHSSFVTSLVGNVDESLTKEGLLLDLNPVVVAAAAAPVKAAVEEVADSWEDEVEEVVAAPVAAATDKVESTHVIEMSTAELNERKQWRSDAVLEEDDFTAGAMDLKTASRYAAYMEHFSATLKGDSRFVPWEVIMGRLEAGGKDLDEDEESSEEEEEEDDDDDKPTAAAAAKSAAGPALSSAEAKQREKEQKAAAAEKRKAEKAAAKKALFEAGGKKADKPNAAEKIRRDNAMAKYKELLVKVGKWIENAKNGYSDVEGAMEFLRDRLLIDLPDEMSKLKRLTNSSEGAFRLSPAESDAPSALINFALLEYAHQAWLKKVKDLTDTSAGGLSAAATQAIAAVNAVVNLCESNNSGTGAVKTGSAKSDAAAAAASAVVTGIPATAFDFSDAFVAPQVLPAAQVPSAAEIKAAQAAADGEMIEEKSAAAKAAEFAARQPVAFSASMSISTSLANRSRNNTSPMDLAARVLQLVAFLWRRYFQTMTAEHARALFDCVQWLGFTDTASTLAEEFVDQQRELIAALADKKAQKAAMETMSMRALYEESNKNITGKRPNAVFNIIPAAPKKGAKADVAPLSGSSGGGLELHALDPKRHSFSRFQLQFGGSRLPRNVGSIPDDRTARFGFWPDRWQWNLLNTVDAKKSALVIAPTSAGKSFISYYVIEKVIDENRLIERSADRGVVVVVLPTVALINQVQAVVYQKYGDVFGVYTARQKHRITQCQVLITLPTQFETMLMSPGLEDWVQHVKYVIFDEVHCIGESSEGAKWERLLSLLQAPFVALSATVGNPQKFLDFLTNVQRAQKREVELISYSQRWSDLHHFFYLPSATAESSWAIDYQKQANTYREMLLQYKTDAEQFKHQDAIKTMERLIVAAEAREREGLPYLPCKEGVWATQPQLGAAALMHIHPCTAVALTGGWDAARGFPADLPFAAQDTVSLYDAMFYVVTQANSPLLSKEMDRLKALKPEAVFEDKFLSKKDVKAYQQLLEDELKRWSRGGVSAAKAASTNNAAAATELGQLLRKCVDNLFSYFSSKVAFRLQDQPEHIYTPDNVFHTAQTDLKDGQVRQETERRFFRLLCELNAADKLPAIVFNFERVFCDHMAKVTLETLERLEKWQKFAEIDPTVQKQKESLLNKLTKEQQRNRDKEVNAVKEEEQKRMAAEAGEDNDPLKALEEDTDVDERFSFVMKKDRMADSDMQYWLNRLQRRLPQWGKNHYLIRALRRGIGVHHEAAPKAYRDLVECLFRGRHIRVVFATGTLAFGVNMPCRTSVFALDSKSLTPTLYRQMSGRAGRRGYDDVGNVIFFGLRAERAAQLMTTKLPSLQGQFPLSASLSLRSLLLQGRLSNAAHIQAAMRVLINDPLLLSAKTGASRQFASRALNYHYRFLLQFLVQTRLLDVPQKVSGLATVSPAPFAALTAVGHDHEPNNFVFALALASGMLREICSAPLVKKSLFEMVPDPKNPSNKLRTRVDKMVRDPVVLRELLLVLAHTAFVLPLPAVLNLRADNEESPHIRSQSRILMDPLRPKLRAHLDQSNRQALDMFVDMCRLLSNTEHGQSVQLPLSRVAFDSSDANSKANVALSARANQFEARSPFVALAGRADHDFGSARELAVTVQSGIELTRSMIPTSELSSFRGLPIQRNAFAIDFMKHAQLKVVMRDNCMRPNVAWDSIRDFSAFLERLTAFSEELILKDSDGKQSDHIVECMKALSQQFAAALEENAWADL